MSENKSNQQEIQTIKVLLVEDNKDFAKVTSQLLIKANIVKFEINHVSNLKEAITILENSPFDVILLDLGLPDSNGLDTLRKLYLTAQEIPIIVLTGNEDEKMGIEALKENAQDYLSKTDINTKLLTRSLMFGIQRKRAEKAEFDARTNLARADRLEQELKSLDDITSNSQVTRRVQVSIARPLQNTDHQVFTEITNLYSSMLENVVNARISKTKKTVHKEIGQIAVQLGKHKATFKDIIDIHSNALKTKIPTGIVSAKSRIYQEEAQLILIELVGFLASFYRNLVLEKSS